MPRAYQSNWLDNARAKFDLTGALRSNLTSGALSTFFDRFPCRTHSIVRIPLFSAPPWDNNDIGYFAAWLTMQKKSRQRAGGWECVVFLGAPSLRSSV